MLQHTPAWAWVGLGALLVVALAVDLVGHRGDRVDSRKAALGWSLAWIALALLFALGLWPTLGGQAAEEFLAVYLLEKSLSVDNLFVFLVLFEALGVPRGEQRRVLTWGILGALISRALFIAAGAALLERWHGLVYVFGALLLFTGVRLLRAPAAEPGEPRLLRWLRRVVPTTEGLRGHRFVVREGGRLRATPLLFALLVVEATDVLFALDSIPAAFAVSETPFVIYAANVFAVFGLRSLYIVLAGALAELKYLRVGLAAVLLLAGLKLLASGVFHPPVWASLGVLGLVLGAAVGASLLARRREGGAAVLE